MSVIEVNFSFHFNFNVENLFIKFGNMFTRIYNTVHYNNTVQKGGVLLIVTDPAAALKIAEALKQGQGANSNEPAPIAAETEKVTESAEQ